MVDEPKATNLVDEVAKLFTEFREAVKNVDCSNEPTEGQKLTMAFAKRVTILPSMFNERQFQKWRKNFLKRQQEKIGEICNLFKTMRNTRNLNDLLSQIENKLAELGTDDKNGWTS